MPTLSGRIRTGGGNAAGRLIFKPNQPIKNVTNNEYMPGGEHEVDLDSDGYFTVDLPATNDPNWTPAGWKWVCVMRLIDEGVEKFEFDLTGNTQFASIAPVNDPTP